VSLASRSAASMMSSGCPPSYLAHFGLLQQERRLHFDDGDKVVESFAMPPSNWPMASIFAPGETDLPAAASRDVLLHPGHAYTTLPPRP